MVLLAVEFQQDSSVTRGSLGMTNYPLWLRLPAVLGNPEVRTIRRNKSEKNQ